MSIRREFIDWSRPALPAAAELLIDSHRDGHTVFLQKTVVALPGGQAGRRLLEILVTFCEEQKLALAPPQITTISQLPELLYAAKKQFADELTQQLAWIEALRSPGRERLSRLVRRLPDDDDFFAWLSLADMFSSLHRELAADLLDFSDVVEQGTRLVAFHEAGRWKLLAEIQQNYLQCLDSQEVWDKQTARLIAIEHAECKTDCEIVLIGMVDMNRTQRAMLDQVEDSVRAFVFAPENLRAKFDEYGCLIPAAWQDVNVPLKPEQIAVCDKPCDQADAVLNAIADFDGRYPADSITIGVPDERNVPYIQQRLNECHLPNRYGVSHRLSRTGPYRFLQAFSRFVESQAFDAFTELARHPDVEQWLTENEIPSGWLSELDDYHAKHLPSRMTGTWLNSKKPAELLKAAFEKIRELAADFRGSERSLTEWGPLIINVLVIIFGRHDLDRDRDSSRAVLVTCEKIRQAILAQQNVPATLVPSVSGAEAIRLTLKSLDGETIPPRLDAVAIELLGWLELPLDDAPALIITGMNEGFVPSLRSSDMFLPNQLRSHLSLEDNARRFARDVYALSLIVASKKDVKFIAGRRTAENDPLIPSRLLFPDDETLAQRTIELFSERSSFGSEKHFAGRLKAGREHDAFKIPTLPELIEPVTSMRVTEFRDYLQCPYRYFLKHRLRLTSCDDTGGELNAADFGILLHNVLKDFGADLQTRELNDSRTIFETLSRYLDHRAAKEYGKTPLPAVQVQVELLRMRLEAFARWQADWTGQGWVIETTERHVKDGEASLKVDGEPMFLKGQIDRIDRNRDGRWVIFDYKTGDTPKNPEDTHRKKKSEWIDLQLPLYRHLAQQALQVEGHVALGYIVIPKDPAKTSEQMADWNNEDLATADRTAIDIIRGIRSGEFSGPVSPPPAFSEELSAICQDHRYGAGIADLTETEEESS